MDARGQIAECVSVGRTNDPGAEPRTPSEAMTSYSDLASAAILVLPESSQASWGNEFYRAMGWIADGSWTLDEARSECAGRIDDYDDLGASATSWRRAQAGRRILLALFDQFKAMGLSAENVLQDRTTQALFEMEGEAMLSSGAWEF